MKNGKEKESQGTKQQNEEDVELAERFAEAWKNCTEKFNSESVEDYIKYIGESKNAMTSIARILVEMEKAEPIEISCNTGQQEEVACS